MYLLVFTCTFFLPVATSAAPPMWNVVRLVKLVYQAFSDWDCAAITPTDHQHQPCGHALGHLPYLAQNTKVMYHK